MSKKQLNIEAITNELQGASAFFPTSRETDLTEPPPSAQEAIKPEIIHSPITERSNEPPNDPLKQRPIIRTKIRHTFDIYEDQLLSLKEINLNREILFGQRVLIGDTVQEALDMFITKERNKE
jgi:hypothetical protein